MKRVGGVQCYVAAKANYLENNGWQVYVFSPGLHSSKYPCPISYMNKFQKGGLVSWLGAPPFIFPKFMVSNTINKIARIIGKVNANDEIIIESHADVYSQWAEILAAKVQGKHFFYTLNEKYRGDRCYEKKMDFYLFKFQRKEILGVLSTFNRLFEGYLVVNQTDIAGDMWIDESPVQDVYCECVEKINKKDYNICYIGRGTKSYVPNILLDVSKFSLLHRDKQIQLLTVGDMDSQRNLIKKIKLENPNLNIVELGFLHPIPKSIYSKVDVVIAGAGCARHSCEEGAMTIVADTETCKSNGLLGYDTMDAVYQDKDSVVTDFTEALERVFVRGVYKEMECKYPPKSSFEKSTLHNFALHEKSAKEKEYYDVEKLLEGAINPILIARRYISDYHPRFVKLIKWFAKSF